MRGRTSDLLVASSRILPSIVFRHQIDMIECRVVEFSVTDDIRVDFTVGRVYRRKSVMSVIKQYHQ